jgi:hypothetical protein
MNNDYKEKKTLAILRSVVQLIRLHVYFLEIINLNFINLKTTIDLYDR